MNRFVFAFLSLFIYISINPCYALINYTKTYINNVNKFKGLLDVVVLEENIVNGVNVLSQGMLNNPNTNYIIKYNYDLEGKEIVIPKGCVLEFQGGCLCNGILYGDLTYINTHIDKIFDVTIDLKGTWNVLEYFPEWFGAKGDGKTDDTKALQKMNGKTTVISEKTYLCTNLEFNSYTVLRGKHRYKSCIKQINGSKGDFIKFVNWFGGELSNLRIEGGDNILEDKTLWMQSLVKIVNYTYRHNKNTKGWNNTDLSTMYSRISNVIIRNSEYSGLSVLGAFHKDNNKETQYNWIHNISQIHVENCDMYGIYDSASDNLWSNINVSHCGFANMYLAGSSEVFTTLKLDGESGYACNDKKSASQILAERYKGALLIILGNNYIIDGMDLQSSLYTGIKLDGSDNHISGSINNCGLKYSNSISNQEFTPAIYFYGENKCENCNINLLIYQIKNIVGSNAFRFKESSLKSGKIVNNVIIINFRSLNGKYDDLSEQLNKFSKHNNVVISPHIKY